MGNMKNEWAENTVRLPKSRRILNCDLKNVGMETAYLADKRRLGTVSEKFLTISPILENKTLFSKQKLPILQGSPVYK